MRAANVIIRIGLALTFAVSLGCQRDVPRGTRTPTQREQIGSAIKRFDDVKTKLVQGKLSDGDANYLRRCLRSKLPGIRASGALLLSMAAQKGLFNESEYEKSLMDGCVKAPPAEASMFLGFFQGFLKNPPVTNPKPPSGRPEEVSTDERKWVDAWLSDPAMKNRATVGRLFVGKHRLDEDSLRFIEDRIASQIKAERGANLRFWRFVEHCVHRRNAPKT